MTYDALLETMAKAAMPLLACVVLITLGAVADVWTNTVATAGSRVWHRVKGCLRDLSPN